jgi:hypothetical protein
MKNNYRKVTMIEDLPELKDLEEHNQPGELQEQKYNKFIRNSYNPPVDSGMGYQELPSVPPPNMNQNMNQDMNQNMNQDMNQDMGVSTMPNANMMPPNMRPPPPQERPYMAEFIPPMYQENFEHPLNSEESEETEKVLNCIDVAHHVDNCPICSKFYKSNNRPLLIIIFILSILCFLLLKKVLDMCNN